MGGGGLYVIVASLVALLLWLTGLALTRTGELTRQISRFFGQWDNKAGGKLDRRLSSSTTNQDVSTQLLTRLSADRMSNAAFYSRHVLKRKKWLLVCPT